MIFPGKFIRGTCIRPIKRLRGKDVLIMEWKKTQNKYKKICRKIMTGIIAFAVSVMTCGVLLVFGAEATVTFGSNWYEKESGEEFPIGVYITGDEKVGKYYVKVQYDGERMEYTGGGDREEDGMVVLEGTGDSDTVKYMLNFRAVGGGEAGIRIYEAEVSAPEGDGGENFHIAQMGAVPVNITGENTAGASFLDRIAEEGAASGDDAETEGETETEDTGNTGNTGTPDQENDILTAGEAETERGSDKPYETEQATEEDTGGIKEGAKEPKAKKSAGISIKMGVIVIVTLAVFLLLDVIVLLIARIKRKRDEKRQKNTGEKERWGFEFETIPDSSSQGWVEDAIARRNRLAGKESAKVSFEKVDFEEGGRR